MFSTQMGICASAFHSIRWNFYDFADSSFCKPVEMANKILLHAPTMQNAMVLHKPNLFCFHLTNGDEGFHEAANLIPD